MKLCAWIIAVSTWLARCGVVPLPVGRRTRLRRRRCARKTRSSRRWPRRWFGIWSDRPGANADAEVLVRPRRRRALLRRVPARRGDVRPAQVQRATARQRRRARFDTFRCTSVAMVCGCAATATARSRRSRSASSCARKGSRATRAVARRSCASARQGEWKIVHEHTSFALLDDWLGGVDADLTCRRAISPTPADHEFQLLIDAYLASSTRAARRTSRAPTRPRASSLLTSTSWCGIRRRADRFGLDRRRSAP